MTREVLQALEELRKKTLHFTGDGSIGVCEAADEKMINSFLEKLDLRNSALGYLSPEEFTKSCQKQQGKI